MIAKIFFILITLVIVSGVAFYILAQKRLADEFFSAHSQIRTTMEMLLPWMIIVYVAGILITFLLTVFYTRRIAGPMLKFDRQFVQIIDGDYTTRISLRKNDELKDLAAGINEVLGNTGRLLGEIEECHQQLKTSLARASKDPANVEEMRSAMQEADKATGELDSIFQKIKY